MTPAPGAPPRVSRPWASSAVQGRLAEIEALAEPGSVREAELAAEAVAAVHRQTERGAVLYAGTNVLAADVIGAHDPELGVRGVAGDPGEPIRPGIPGLDSFDLLEVFAARAVGIGLGAPFVDVRPQSATLANLAVYTGLTPVGATIASLAPAAGGHFSHHRRGAAGVRGHQVVELPFDGERQDVDPDALRVVLERERPALVVLGGSVQLFPNDLPTVVAAAREVGARVLFDASHPAGLIVGGAFPNPLDAGVDAITFSTYKTYGGPTGGVVACRDEQVARPVMDAVFPGLTANYDASRLRPLLLAARALLADGEAYASRCVELAQALAASLSAAGLAVMASTRGFTQTNQVVVRVADEAAALAAIERCLEAGVFLSATEYSDEHGPGQALRLGTQELARRGVDVRAAEDLGPLLAALVAGGISGEDARRRLHLLLGYEQDRHPDIEEQSR